MKTKPSKQLNQPKQSKLKDLKPKKNPTGGALNVYVSKLVGEKQGTVKGG